MKWLARFSLFAYLLLQFSSIRGVADVTGIGNDSASKLGAAASVNSFAIDVFPRIARTEGNFFFSPYSAENILTLTWAGARSQTAKQMAAVLHLITEDKTAVHDGFAALRLSVQSARSNLVVANSMWCQKGTPYRDEFLKIGTEKYGAALNQVDFSQTEVARRQINDWAGKETHGKIEELVPTKAIDASTRLILADANYFKAPWRIQFDPSKTKNAPFRRAGKKAEEVPLMNLQSQFTYGESKTEQVLELPYVGGKFSMLILLPKDVGGLPALERSLNDVELTQLLSWVKPQIVNVFLPKFKFAAETQLQDTLQEVGMTDAFSPDFAKFSGISTTPLYISAVLQKSWMEVDEKGTQAATASAVIMTPSGEPRPDTFLFRADHPFVFLIRHNETGAILFMGRFTQP